MALERRTWRTLTCALVAIVLVVLCCRVTGGTDPDPAPTPTIDANGPQRDDALPPDVPDDGPEPQLDASTSPS